MSTPVGYADQYCPIARALDALGDRWTLLVIRELAVDSRRFSELQRRLPGIAPTVLSDRLKTLVAYDLVAADPIEGTTTRVRYRLTRSGRHALPVLAALVRFGMPLLEDPPPDDQLRPRLVVNSSLAAYFDLVAAVGIDEHYRVCLGGETIDLDTRAPSRKPSTRPATAAARKTTPALPDLVVTSPVGVWIDIRRGRLRYDELVADGTIRLEGSRTARAHFRAVYQLARPPAPLPD